MSFVEVEPAQPWELMLAALEEIIRPTFSGNGPTLLERLDAWYASAPVGPTFHATPVAAATRLTVPTEARSALVSITGADCNVSFDGTDATAANGLYVPAGTILKLGGRESMHGFSALQVGVAAVIDAVFFT